MKQSNGAFRQRVGALIEQHICERYELFFNKRQQTKGFYDAHKDGSIFEIKAAKITHKEFVLLGDNHKKLAAAGGYYIFVSYDLSNHDSRLKVISDIVILDIYVLKAQDLTPMIKEYGVIKEKRGREHVKIGLARVRAVEDKKTNPESLANKSGVGVEWGNING